MGDLAVIDSGDEEEAESEATASVAIAIRDDFEAFEPGDDVLTGDAFAGDGAVSGFVVLGQWVLIDVRLLNSRKSCRRPLSCAMHRMRRVDFCTTTCVFNVCRFFLPES